MLRQLVALLAALLIALLVFGWAEGFSSSFQNCINNSPTQAAEQNSKDQNNTIKAVRSYVRCTERFADSHNALITALATVLLAAITFGLILSGVDQQNTTRAQLRAYLSVEPGANARQSQRKHSQFEFRPDIVNSGQTPAHDVYILSRMDLVSPIIPDAFDYGVDRKMAVGPRSVAAIGPRQKKYHAALFIET